MRVLVVQNFEKTALGQVGRALAEAEAEIEMIMAHEGEPLPPVHGRHDAIIVLGGAQNALADEAHPYLPQLANLMADFAIAGKAVLGICLGSQILARGLGAENLIGAAPEFGWQEVTATEAGRIDPVLRAAPAQFPIFQWHDDTFTLPEGAVRLASNAAVENQAFRFGRAAYGMQFHFEADRRLVEGWNADFAGHLAEFQPDWANRHPKEAARHGPEADAAGLAIARAWVALI